MNYLIYSTQRGECAQNAKALVRENNWCRLILKGWSILALLLFSTACGIPSPSLNEYVVKVISVDSEDLLVSQNREPGFPDILKVTAIRMVVLKPTTMQGSKLLFFALPSNKKWNASSGTVVKFRIDQHWLDIAKARYNGGEKTGFATTETLVGLTEP